MKNINIKITKSFIPSCSKTGNCVEVTMMVHRVLVVANTVITATNSCARPKAGMNT